jgi:hypothetical protein
VGQFTATNVAAVVGNVRRGHRLPVAAGARACTANAADVGGVFEDEIAVGDRARCRLAKRRDLRAALLVRLAINSALFSRRALLLGSHC